MDEREARLPTWAQELITRLRRQIKYATEPMLRELDRLRPQVLLLKRKNEALTELLDCASRGEHKTSHEIMEVIRSYSLTLTPEDE